MQCPADPRSLTLRACREAARAPGVLVTIWSEPHKDGMVWKRKTVGQAMSPATDTGWLWKVAKSDDARMMQVVNGGGFPWAIVFIAIDELHQCLYYAVLPDELERQWDTPSAEERGG